MKIFALCSSLGMLLVLVTSSLAQADADSDLQKTVPCGEQFQNHSTSPFQNGKMVTPDLAGNNGFYVYTADTAYFCRWKTKPQGDDVSYVGHVNVSGTKPDEGWITYTVSQGYENDPDIRASHAPPAALKDQERIECIVPKKDQAVIDNLQKYTASLLQKQITKLGKTTPLVLQGRITKEKGDLEVLKKGLSDLQARLTQIQAKIADPQTQKTALPALNGQADSLNGQVTAAQGPVDRLQASIGSDQATLKSDMKIKPASCEGIAGAAIGDLASKLETLQSGLKVPDPQTPKVPAVPGARRGG